MNEAIIQDAETAIDKCGLRGYIDGHDLTIYKRLIGCYIDAMGGKEVDRLVLLADSLEVASHVVHLGTSRQRYYDGVSWIHERYPGADARAVLAALTLIFILRSAETEKGAHALRKAGAEINLELSSDRQVDPVGVWTELRKLVEAVLAARP